MFELRERNGVTFIVCRPLEASGAVNAFSTRVGGVSPLPDNALNLGYISGDRESNVTENRQRFLSATGWPNDHLLTMRQTHSDACRLIDDPEVALGERPACDAMVTQQVGVLLGAQTADCAPILVYDPMHQIIAAIHAGWRGTLNQIVLRALRVMKERAGTEAADCLVAIGPAIQPCCYEVGPDVIGPFHQTFSFAPEVFRDGAMPHHAYLDVAGTNRRLLAMAGVEPANIFVCHECTACRNDLFFSYRREKGNGYSVGRQLSVIGLTEQRA
jgi:hypothetical protein